MTEPQRVEIVAMTAADVPAVIGLAHRIWNAHYPSIIGQAQVDYMLAQRYTPERLNGELASPDIRWECARRGGELVGFSSTIHLREERELKLDKLYVAPEVQGGGVGRALVDSATRRARALGCGALILAVNKHNASAIAAYRRFGFAERASVTVEIGGGFVMDDFIMARSL